MPGSILAGLAAGAVGTVALNVVTYTDMLIRGRGSSSVPADVADELTDAAHVPLAGRGEDEDARENRKTALGALFGYVAGLGVGAAYGLLRPRVPHAPRMLTGVLAGAAAMAASDVPAAALGVTDPSMWSRSGWVSDIVPHLAYGVAVAVAFDSFSGRDA